MSAPGHAPSHFIHRPRIDVELPMITESSEQMSVVESRVLRIFRDTLDLDVDVDTDVIGGDLLDSLAFVQLLVSLEDEFGIKVELSRMDLDDFSSAASIALVIGSTGIAPG